jgi:hypothetical protein
LTALLPKTSRKNSGGEMNLRFISPPFCLEDFADVTLRFIQRPAPAGIEAQDCRRLR